MSTPRSFPRWTVASLILALIGNMVAAAFLVMPLYSLAPGSSVRLLGESFHSALASVGTLIVVAVFVVIAWCRENRRVVLIIVLCLALTPFPFAGWAMRQVAANRNILLKA